MTNAEPKIVFMDWTIVSCFVVTSRSIKFAILLRCFDVAPCPAGDVRLLIERQLPANFCGRAEHQ